MAVRTVLRVMVLIGCVLLSSAASAQQASGIAGVVRDTSGAVRPGVTVEASSPALIEKVRSAVTDGEGRYNIINLLPGTYTVTFGLGGFSTVLNGNSVLGVNQTYGSQWLRPIAAVASSTPAVLNGRFIQFSGELKF